MGAPLNNQQPPAAFQQPDPAVQQPAAFAHTHDSAAANQRIGSFMSHSFELLAHLENQIMPLTEKDDVPQLRAVFDTSKEALVTIKERLVGSISKEPLTKREIKDLSDEIKKAEKEIGKVLRDTQIAIAAEIGSTGKDDAAAVKSNITTLAKGGKKAGMMKVLNKVFGAYSDSVSGLKEGSAKMKEASQKNFTDVNIPLSEIEIDKASEFASHKSSLGGKKNSIGASKRKGVIGVNGEYRIKASFSKKENKAILKSFISQNQSARVRKPIVKEVHVGGSVYSGNLIPLNAHFDSHINSEIAKLSDDVEPISTFGAIAGEAGISSNNRNETNHLINGWESSLSKNGTRIYQSLRHAITSDKFEHDPIKRTNSAELAAKELLMAAVMQRLADKPLEKGETYIPLNFNSVSLVTPDHFRAISLKNFIFGKLDCEKRMLKDQQEALHALSGKSFNMVIDGRNVMITPTITSFNFGVNEGAVGVRIPAVGAKFYVGTRNQRAQNKIALQGLKNQYATFSHTANRLDAKKAQALMEDINHLMRSKNAYLGGNQYEVGAKILLLSNLMNTNESTTKCAFNCMSGKDRTGIMDGVAKTLAIMGQSGEIPSHADLTTDDEIRTRFTEILLPILRDMGGLELVQLNTDARGYKVGKEAMLGLEADDFLALLGLAKTTSS